MRFPRRLHLIRGGQEAEVAETTVAEVHVVRTDDSFETGSTQLAFESGEFTTQARWGVTLGFHNLAVARLWFEFG
jgi:hypothetical protein